MSTPEQIKELHDALLKLTETLSKFDAELNTASTTTTGYKAKLDEAKRSELAYKDALVLVDAELTKTNNLTKETSDKLLITRDAWDKNKRSIEQVNAAFKRSEDEIKKTGTSLQDLTSKFKAHGLAVASFFGASAFGFSAARDQLLKYNEAMFAFSRIQQVAGNGTKDISSAFDRMSRSTTFSKHESAEFFNTFARGYAGIKPTATAMSSFAADIQSSFGPNVKEATRIMNEFLGVQNKIPALFDQMRSVMLMSRDASISIKDLNKARAATIATMMWTGNLDQLDNFAQATIKTTKEQDKLTEASKGYYKVGQQSNDLMLGGAQAVEKQFVGGAKAATAVLEVLNKWPASIILATLAMRAFATATTQAGVAQTVTTLGGLGGKTGMLGKTMGRFGFGGKVAAGAIGSAGAGNLILRQSGGFLNAGAETAAATSKAAIMPAGKLLGAEVAGAGKIGLGGMLKAGGKAFAPIAAVGTALDIVSEYSSARDEKDAQGNQRGKFNSGVNAVKKAGSGLGGALSFGLTGFAIGGPLGAGIGLAVAGAASLVTYIEKSLEATKAMVKPTEGVGEEFVKQTKALDAAKRNMEMMIGLAEKLTQTSVGLSKVYRELQTPLNAAQNLAMKKTIEISMVVQKESIDKGGDQIKEWMTLLSESVGKDLSRGIEDAMKGIDFSTEPEKAIAAMGDYKALSHETTAEQEKRKKVIDEEIDAIDQVIIKLQKETDKEQEINEERKKRGALAKEKSRLVSPAELAGAAVNEIQQQQKRIASRSAEYANGEMERLNQNFDIAQTYNQVLEKRLGIERELMEQANFGMGASVQAMQRQVDLAYEMMGIEKQRIASIESTLKSKMDEGAAEAALNARSAAERKEIVDAHTKDKNDVGFINQLLTKRQESMSTMTCRVMSVRLSAQDDPFAVNLYGTTGKFLK